MTKLLKELGAIIVFMLLLAFGFEYHYAKFNTRVDLLFHNIENNQDTELLLLGNSHIGVLNATLFPEQYQATLNLSMGGQDLFHAYSLVKTAIEKLPKLNTIILGVDYDLLGYSLATTNQGFIDRQYFVHTDTLQEFSLANQIMASSAFFRHNRDLALLVQSAGKSESKKQNFIPITKEANNPIACKKRALEHSKLKFDKALIQTNIEVIEDIRDLCKRNEKQFIMITTPKRKCYLESVDNTNIQLAKSALDKLTKALEIKHYDFEVDKRFSNDDFIDPDHLNKAGAEKLIELLIQQLGTSKN